MSSSCLAVLTAAGSGTRLGCDGPKALVPVGGVPMVVRAVDGLVAAGVDGIVITAPLEAIDDFRRLFPGGVAGVAGKRHVPLVPVDIVAGSQASRQASVALGLEGLRDMSESRGLDLVDDSVVLIHDAARCLTPVEAIRRVIDAVEQGYHAVIPTIPVSDTLKRVGDAKGQESAPRPVHQTVDRSSLVAVQTPQGFTWKVISAAHERGASRSASEITAATDDAGLVEEMGGIVYVVDGDHLSLKVTTALDLTLAEVLITR
ncbi:IspD/TarI family cytidylyltransferase [Schaalia sp. ZJ1691]|uniref:IspD/TarI family cytidylyltransferase n=1 Tax=Schaalia sp. ZJ1691 TaxID=2709404 RepID=UPI0013EA2DFE|nr:IspD/TarI family cytidylyltransferase [Schaalia sp. ZJ1691]